MLLYFMNSGPGCRRCARPAPRETSPSQELRKGYLMRWLPHLRALVRERDDARARGPECTAR